MANPSADTLASVKAALLTIVIEIKICIRKIILTITIEIEANQFWHQGLLPVCEAEQAGLEGEKA